jgi:uncharacterized metal-binding protein
VKEVRQLACARCEHKVCIEGHDCFGSAEKHREFFGEPEVGRVHRAATAIEARHYGEKTRLGEIILFARELGCRIVGLAFCIGLSDEARIVDEILSQHFDVLSVCCKACGIDKAGLGLEQIDQNRRESICNSAGQAELLNRAGAELNVLLGLCVGHDSIFQVESEAPVTTLVAKDRMLAHNPVGAIYCQYVRRHLSGT